MDSNEWANLRPETIRTPHFILVIGCPQPGSYPGVPATCVQFPGEPIAVAQIDADGKAQLPAGLLAALLRNVADQMIEIEEHAQEQARADRAERN